MSKVTVLWDDRTMKENTLPLTTFVSPQTGTEYLIVAKPQRRMRGGILEGCPMYWADYTQYDIVLNGNPVGFCFDEEDVAREVNHFENPLTEAQLAIMHSRFD
jgi:hypothetical protein